MTLLLLRFIFSLVENQLPGILFNEVALKLEHDVKLGSLSSVKKNRLLFSLSVKWSVIKPQKAGMFNT